jgi:hypothetical protein
MVWKNYIIGLFDMLGQGRKLSELGSLCWKLHDRGNLLEDDSKKMKELTSGTYEEVEYFRQLFTGNFNSMKNHLLQHPRIDALLPSEQEIVTKIANDICKLRSFSDLVIFYTPFDVKHELITRVRISAMLSACTCVLILETKAGTFFRGGIEIGAGTELSNGDIYGPVLNEAHRLEKDVADYPRIVIGNKLKDFIQSETQAPDAGEFLNAVFVRVHDLCKKLICLDDDGKMIVDYLGKTASELSQFQGSKACDFVKKGLTKLENELNVAKKEGNRKRIKRYEKLQAYYHCRMKFWDN